MPEKVSIPTCFNVALTESELAELGKAAILAAYTQATDAGLNSGERLWMTVPITIEIGFTPTRTEDQPPQQLKPCTNPSVQYLWCIQLDGFSWCM